MNLGTAFASKQNNFDFMRFALATLVLISHSFALTHIRLFAGENFKVDEPLYKYSGGLTDLGTFAVTGFFFISGMLITKSWLDHPRFAAFIGKRFLRITPALITATILGMIIGLLSTTLSIKQYIFDPTTWSYLNNILMYPVQFILPGVFVNNIYPQAVNGSIWTLPYEFTCYLITAFIGSMGLFSKRNTYWILGIAIFALLFNVFLLLPNKTSVNLSTFSIWLVNLGLFYPNAVYFALGIAAYYYRRVITLNWLVAIVCAGIYFIGLSLRDINKIHIFTFFAPILVSYALLVFSFAKVGLSNFGRLGDGSYGMYIYAFPIQQLVVHLFVNKFGLSGLSNIDQLTKFYSHALTPLTLFMISFPLTLFVAALSWYWIEKPALGLKKYFDKSYYPEITAQAK